MTKRQELQGALDTLLSSLAAGARLDDELTHYPTLAADLRPLLLAAQSAGAAHELRPVPVVAQAASRAQFLARASESAQQ